MESTVRSRLGRRTKPGLSCGGTAVSYRAWETAGVQGMSGADLSCSIAPQSSRCQLQKFHRVPDVTFVSLRRLCGRISTLWTPSGARLNSSGSGNTVFSEILPAPEIIWIYATVCCREIADVIFFRGAERITGCGRRDRGVASGADGIDDPFPSATADERGPFCRRQSTPPSGFHEMSGE